MRGIPTQPVVCGLCGDTRGCPKDHLCHRCRIKQRRNPNKKFIWTPALDDALRRAYKSSHSRRELIANLNDVQRLTRFSRFAIVSRASALGLASCKKRPWSPSDIETLRENLGSQSVRAIANKLGRTFYSVKAQMAHLALSARLTDGYTREQLRELFGVSARRVHQWIELGWLQLKSERVTERSVIAFLRNHPREYELSRVDEAWFKGLLFPAFNRFEQFPEPRQRQPRCVYEDASLPLQ